MAEPPALTNRVQAALEARPAPTRALRCASCEHPITSVAERIEAGGKHLHTRINPGGWVHRFGCFRAAPGARSSGPPTPASSWFPDHVWTLALCASCEAHLGWRFSGASEFWGLVLDALREG